MYNEYYIIFLLIDPGKSNTLDPLNIWKSTFFNHYAKKLVMSTLKAAQWSQKEGSLSVWKLFSSCMQGFLQVLGSIGDFTL